MPWKLIVFILIFAVVLAFITFNLGNKCDISFGPGPLTIKDVPVFLTVFISFILGLLSTLPFIIKARKRKDVGKDKKPGKDDFSPKDGAFLDGVN